MKYVMLFMFALTFLIGLAQEENKVYKFKEDLEKGLNNDSDPYKYQNYAVFYSQNNLHAKSLELYNINKSKTKQGTTADSINFKSYKQVLAKDYLLEQAKNQQVLIINEIHANSSHRTFVRHLLKDLYKQGYRFLGLEALFDLDINKRKFATLESGFYTKDPEFATLIQQAIATGFIVFGYEGSDFSDPKIREQNQAENIYKKIKENPKGKFLILCGHAHVQETETPNWGKTMAVRLQDLSGINPYTINQETFTERGFVDSNHPFINLNKTKEPIVLLKDDQPFRGFNNNPTTDLVLINPATDYVNHRPHWFIKGKKKVELPAKYKLNKNMLVLAYRDKEYEKGGIPADVLELTTDTKNSALYLLPGAYYILIKDGGYKKLSGFKIQVK